MATVQELQKNGTFAAIPELVAMIGNVDVSTKAEIVALTAIADPATATATDVANKVNAIIAALKA
ncbi:MAG: hypothetical protein Tp178MES00d2C33159851_122 [Prokaryotic dsDNA virus sp.]|nr:MAG: hypothetical protein Tp178MES00d2C33159851_122 [Prokaryotic dsDNA virus sp.]|tara:strand:+ start:25441 stop:25635 length:195 start_codon:yes stop_codon:yes gene_type:complete